MGSAGSLRFDAGGAALSWPRGPRLRGVTAAVHYHVRGKAGTLHLTRANRAVESAGLQATWFWEKAQDGMDVWVEVANVGSSKIALAALDVFAVRAAEGGVCDLGVPPNQWAFYHNGWQSWSPTFARQGSASLYTDPATPDYRQMHQPHRDPTRGDNPASEWVTVIRGDRATALLLGFVTMADQLAEIQLDLEAGDWTALVARCYIDGVALRPGERLRSERLWVRAGPDPLALLEDWAARAGRQMQARIPPSPPTGWCTWYYFFGANTAGDILENLEAIARYNLPLDVIVIDDGYQTAIGDWLSVDAKKFPQGMAPVMATIRGAGRVPGIWTAPFAAASSSRLFADHPDWVLRDELNRPVVAWRHMGTTPCYALDCTRGEVLAWLDETFRRIRSEWGAQFFKIDFLYAAALAGRRHDANATRAQALRRGVETIRAAIGDDAFLLGCGAPLGPCVGLVDGMRVGPDVSPNWHPIWSHDLSMPATENALRNSLARAPFHGRLWANDPDCVLVRQRGAEQELVLNEMRTLAASAALLGGITLNADHLPVTRPGRLKYLHQTLPPTGVSARPLDLFEHEMPRLLLLSVRRPWGRWWIAAAINWSDRTVETAIHLAELGLPAGRYHVYNYWRRRYLGVAEGTVLIRRHQPHETAVLLLKPVSEDPDLLTTTFHVCQGTVEVARCTFKRKGAEARILVVLHKDSRQFGEILFTVPEGWRAVSAWVEGERRPLAQFGRGVIGLGLTLEGTAEVEVTFHRG